MANGLIEKHVAREDKPARVSSSRRVEGLGIGALGLLVVYFLGISWRKWPDPIVDFGQQCYAIWRLSQGAALYHDLVWNYGPLSIFFNAGLFRCFGPGIMVLAAANLVIYGLILSLAYLAFRRAWGWRGAFAALAVFISVFSFSHLLAVGNYNFATPYAAESTHGMLLILATAFVVLRWYRRPARGAAFGLGLCGGLAAVMKPEFMLATGVLGITAVILRWVHRQRVSLAEVGLMLAGLALPTLAFTCWFARGESVKAAFIDASQAWWLVLVEQVQRGSAQQQNFSGLDHPWGNALAQMRATLCAVAVVGAIWAAGWLINRPWSMLMRVVTVLAAVTVVWWVRLDRGWFVVGRSFPGLIIIILIVIGWRLRREVRATGQAEQGTVMALVLALLAGVMLARMPLFARIYHLGFFQAALAGMVAAAVLVAEVPRWTGAGRWGRGVTMWGCGLLLAAGCVSIAAMSHEIRAEQTEPVGQGVDRFYAVTRNMDATGALVNWAAEKMQSAPPQATLLVLPEGVMINYLSRHRSLEPGWLRGVEEKEFLEQLRKTPPDYVVLITRDLSEFGVARFGAPGNVGFEVVKWVANNYSIESALGGDPLAPKAQPGAWFLQRKRVK